MFLKLLPITIFVFLSFFAPNVLACQCRGFATPYEAFQNADVVFVGKVVSIKDSLGQEISQNKIGNWWDGYYRKNEGADEYNRFAVQEWFKGEKKSEAIISTEINMCQQGFVPDETYLIYAYKSGTNLQAHLFCSRIYFGDTDVFFLRELLANKPEPSIYGSVKFPDKSFEKIKIVAQKGKRKYYTFTDKNRLYRFNKLPDGKYKVYPQLPKKYALDWSITRLEEINLQKNKEDRWKYFKTFGPSAYSDFALRWNNTISGKVLDAEGKQVDRATIRLLQSNQVSDEPFNKEEKIAEYVPWDNREKNLRKYNINGKTPGNYILAFEIFAPFVSGQQTLRLYYPQSLTPERAEPIHLGESTQRNIDLKLPEGFIVRDLEGIFVGEAVCQSKEGQFQSKKWKIQIIPIMLSMNPKGQRMGNSNFRFLKMPNIGFTAN